MRWMVIGLVVSLLALLLVAGAVARYVWRQRRMVTAEAENLDSQKQRHLDLDRALDLGESKDPKESTTEPIP